MNDERRRWQKQFDSNFGAKEFLRFGAVFMVGIFIGILVSIIFESVIPLILFLFAPFAFALVAYKWKPAYLVLRKILGNPDLPNEPIPGRTTLSQPRPWWSFLPGLWWLAMVTLLIFLAVRLLVK